MPKLKELRFLPSLEIPVFLVGSGGMQSSACLL